MTATMDARRTQHSSDRARIGRMKKVNGLGDLERAVMDALWNSSAPQTVRQVHESLNRSRNLAYTTVMTVLQRLAKKNLVVQHRDRVDRPRRPARVQPRPRAASSDRMPRPRSHEASGR